ncbi:MAG: methyltransferase [Gammaproteobacteria bacterium]|nr:class I SAM-dependent methyltransferase [Gammaproteobacteria bacterium]PCH63788.1 MAG: methyltransferase [Gammaproteobacteria bacterium]
MMLDRQVLSKTAILACGLMMFATPTFAEDKTLSLLKEVLAGDHRSDANKARDQYRHPLETLTFLGIKPDMTVVEISPGGGWYTEVLAPFLKDKGQFYAAGADPKSSIPYFQGAAKKFKTKMQSNNVYSNVKIVPFAPPQKTEIAPAGSADRVLTFRNIHNWMDAGTTDDVYAAMYKALKPGGILGVVEHRGNPNTPQDPKAGSGYVNQDVAIAQAEKAGFKLVETSEVNANAKDDKNHPKGVWTLPPRLKLEKQDKTKYLAIGESDRFTLKFVKPAK